MSIKVVHGTFHFGLAQSVLTISGEPLASHLSYYVVHLILAAVRGGVWWDLRLNPAWAFTGCLPHG